MKAVLGVDLENRWRKSAHFLKAMNYADLEVRLVHAVRSMMPDGQFPAVGPMHPYGQLIAGLEQYGRGELAKADDFFESAGIPCTTTLHYGDPSQALDQEADDLHADLMVVAAERKSSFGHLFFGSVAKGVLIGASHSVLFAKKEPPEGRGLKAIFATDHSPYADRCVELLLANPPRSLSRLIVLTADSHTLSMTPLLGSEYGPLAVEIAPEWSESLPDRNLALTDKLKELAQVVESRVIEGRAGEVIDEQMKLEEADLLIICAQGHGFLERVTMGSTSFNQVISSDHSVLVLRLPSVA